MPGEMKKACRLSIIKTGYLYMYLKKYILAQDNTLVRTESNENIFLNIDMLVLASTFC